MIIMLVFLFLVYVVGINKLTCIEISRLGSGDYFTTKEVIVFVFFWPWKG